MYQYTVSATRYITPDVLLLTLRPKTAKDHLRFYAGQYAAIGFKRYGRPSPMRCFSIVSSPFDASLQFAIRVHGTFTRAVATLVPGDIVFVQGPFGSFGFDEEYDRSVVMIAGGIGITPCVSMIRYATQAKLRLPITLLYSNRTKADIAFKPALDQYEQLNPYFTAHHFITRGSDDGTPQTIRLYDRRIDETQLNEAVAGQYNSHTYFICGPKNFIQTMQDLLEAHGVDPMRIITEEFTPSTPSGSVFDMRRHTIPRWTYALTGTSLALAVIFFMALDLDAHAAQLSTPASTSTTQPTTTNTVSPATTTNTISTTTSQTPNTEPTSNQSVYQMPITSVS